MKKSGNGELWLIFKTGFSLSSMIQGTFGDNEMWYQSPSRKQGQHDGSREDLFIPYLDH